MSGRDRQAEARRTKSSPEQEKVGPLLGWSCHARENVLNCRLVIETDDLLEAAKLARSLTANSPGSQVGSKKTP